MPEPRGHTPAAAGHLEASMDRSRWGGILLLTFLVGAPAFSQPPSPAAPLPGAGECRNAAFPFPVGGKVLADGRAVYEKHCLSCHGSEGASEQGGDLRRLSDYSLGSRHADLYRSVWYGVPGVEGHDFAGKLSPVEAWQVTAWLMSLATPPKAATSPSGLQSVTLRAGNGRAAAPGDQVVAHYTGWLTDGTVFDSSYRRGEPFEFTLGARQVISGWDEGVRGMKPGELRQLVIPAPLAYGARSVGSIPANSTLVFQVELVDLR